MFDSDLTIAEFAYSQLIEMMSEKPIPPLQRVRLVFAEQERFQRLMSSLFAEKQGRAVVPVQWGSETAEIIFGLSCKGQAFIYTSDGRNPDGTFIRSSLMRAKGEALLELSLEDDAISMGVSTDTTLLDVQQRVRRLRGLPPTPANVDAYQQMLQSPEPPDYRYWGWDAVFAWQEHQQVTWNAARLAAHLGCTGRTVYNRRSEYNKRQRSGR